MHIAMVTPYPQGKPKGGVEAAAVNLVRQLVGLSDHRLTILAPSYQGRSHTEERDGYTIEWIVQPPLGFISYWTIFRSRIQQKLKELEPDVVHFQATLALSNGYRGPYLGTVHGLGEQDIRNRGGKFSECRARIVAWAERRARQRLSDCIVINPYVGEMLEGQLGKAILHNIGNPLDATFFDKVPE